MMNPQVKELWLKALRSGEYKQGTGALAISSGSETKSDKFCCLGVLCDLAVAAGIIPPPVLGDDYNEYTYDDRCEASLPPKVMHWAGLNFSDPRVDGVCLSTHNDDGKRFTTIANLIEKHL